nr:MAG: ORF1 [TTV-like mini virus]
MAPYYRYRNWYRRPWNNYRTRRYRIRPRRSRKAFRRKRRHRWVRRKFFTTFKRKKLKKLKLQQWQPNHIKKCKIKGYLQLFGAGYGAFSNNFAMQKDSIVPEHEPGGGGWSIQQLTLGNLYTQNELLMNWWTKSNHGLNLCRYLGCRIILYRQQLTDYIFAYDIEPPYNVTKYYYASTHPMQLIKFNKRVIVPSIQTQPLKRKTYKTLRIRPPKEMKNQWYFQQNFSTFPLIQFTAVACSLNSMFMPTNMINNNITLYCINTRFFQNNIFEYPQTGNYGYVPKDNTYIYGIPQAAHILLDTKVQDCVYLGNTHFNDPGDTMQAYTNLTDYNQAHWGNPFYYAYINGDMPSFITSIPPDRMITEHKSKKLNDIKSQITFKSEPYIITTRYNPNKDKGHENIAYWKSNVDSTQRGWEPTADPDLQITKFPLWILLWGWKDYTVRLGKLRNMSQEYMLIFKTNCLPDKLPAYVVVSESFVHGQGPYGVDRNEIASQDYSHWYPRWRYQVEAVEAILETGPGVCKSEKQKSIQAHIKYQFFFKWGGNPSAMENVYDPNSQPTYPVPSNFNITNEINDPTTPIQNFIYTFDTRRDYLTERALQRITQIQTDEQFMFSDGTATSTDLPLQQTTPPQEKTTQEKEKETLLQQLNLIQQYNQQLRFRFNKLTQQMQSL